MTGKTSCPKPIPKSDIDQNSCDVSQEQDELKQKKTFDHLSTHELLLPALKNRQLSISRIAQCIENHGAEVDVIETRSILPAAAHQTNGHAVNGFWRKGEITSDKVRDIFIRFRCTMKTFLDIECDLRLSYRAVIHRLTLDDSTRSLLLENTPPFPRKASDIDFCPVEPSDDYFPSDHPCFKDVAYRKRRNEISKLSLNYKHGQIIPYVEYTDEEVGTWKTIYNKLKTQLEKHACSEYRTVFLDMEKRGLISPDFIPQLEDISRYMRASSGFQLRPAAGLVSSRDFLASLAVKVFQSTQYVRHNSNPLHTPEPDCCHEFLGHVPMLCDRVFARFSQEIGLTSLGASDEDIKKLATLYWFTVEFGLCRQNGDIRAYGAGILSSIGEMENALSDKPELKSFDLEKVVVQEYTDQTYQPIYFVAPTFEQALADVSKFSKKCIKKPFEVVFNDQSELVEIIQET